MTSSVKSLIEKFKELSAEDKAQFLLEVFNISNNISNEERKEVFASTENTGNLDDQPKLFNFFVKKELMFITN